MSIKSGNKNIVNVCLGIKPFSNIYLGSKLLFTKKQRLLPDEYQEVEYIESNGSQYIETDFVSSSNSRVMMKVEFNNISGLQRITGYHNGVDNQIYHPYIADGKFRFAYGYNYIDTDVAVEINKIYKIDSSLKYGEQVVNINGNITKTSITASFTPDRQMFLFSYRDYDGTAKEKSKIKLYYAKYFSDDILVRDYVPCYRKSDGKAGLYDLVNNTFSVDESGGNFVYEDKFEHYQEVEYIESNGSQYIDTGVLSANSRFVANYEFTEINNVAQHISSWWKESKNQIYHPYLGTDGYFYYATRSGGINTNIKAEINKSYIINSLLRSGYQEITINGKVITNSNSGTLTPISFYLFCSHDSESGAYRLAKIKLYYAKYYDNDILVRDYVPCYRKSDGEIGLFDKVNNKFYRNAGTGTFLKGIDIN